MPNNGHDGFDFVAFQHGNCSNGANDVESLRGGGMRLPVLKTTTSSIHKGLGSGCKIVEM